MQGILTQFDGIYNFRDIGGLPIRGGGQMRPCLYYRSGQHHSASDADLATIADLRLRTVVDLRGADERQRNPCRRPAGFAAAVVHADDDVSDDVLPPHERAVRNTRTLEEAVASMRDTYRHFPFGELMIRALGRYLLILADAEGPVLVHCFAGKDRTGLAVAILQTLIGGHRDDVFAEYLLSNAVITAERPFGMSREEIRTRYGRELNDEAILALIGVDESYLQAAFDAIIKQCGSISTYTTQVLRVPPDAIERLVDRLVA